MYSSTKVMVECSQGIMIVDNPSTDVIILNFDNVLEKEDTKSLFVDLMVYGLPKGVYALDIIMQGDHTIVYHVDTYKSIGMMKLSPNYPSKSTVILESNGVKPIVISLDTDTKRLIHNELIIYSYFNLIRKED